MAVLVRQDFNTYSRYNKYMADISSDIKSGKSAVERDIYDSTPQEVLDLYEKLGLIDEAKRREFNQSFLVNEDVGQGLQWIQLRS